MERHEQNAQAAAKAALKVLEEAWAYYTPEPLPVKPAPMAEQEEIFQYHNAA